MIKLTVRELSSNKNMHAETDRWAKFSLDLPNQSPNTHYHSTSYTMFTVGVKEGEALWQSYSIPTSQAFAARLRQAVEEMERNVTISREWLQLYEKTLLYQNETPTSPETPTPAAVEGAAV